FMIGLIAKTLVETALKQDETAKAIAIVVKIFFGGKFVPMAFVLIGPDVFDLKRLFDLTRNVGIKIRFDAALLLNVAGNPGENVMHVMAILHVQIERVDTCKCFLHLRYSTLKNRSQRE